MAKGFPETYGGGESAPWGVSDQGRREIWERLQEAYKVFPTMQEHHGQMTGTMSGGEQAMVPIGRGLMSAAELLLVDEPSLGLSPWYVKENFKIIQRINERGVTVFLVEQNVCQTLAISHYGYVLAKGQVAAEGTPEQLTRSDSVHAAYFS